MNKKLNQLATFIIDKCKTITNHEIINNELIVSTKIANIHKLIKNLKDLDNLNFDMLLDITAVDYPKRAKRFELVYILLSLKNKLRIRVKVFLSENENIPSITSIYKSAAWYER